MAKSPDIIVGVAQRAETLALLKSAVDATGNRFSGAKSGPDCLELLGRVTPRLIMLELGGPELDGLRLCADIHAVPRLKDIPILCLAAEKTPEIVEAVAAAGGNDVVARRDGVPALCDRIQHWLRRSTIIMGVDDSADNLGLVKYAAESSGYGFIGASSGAECLELLSQVTPKLILLDIKMPEMNGFEVCKRIRAIATLKTVPIAFLTAEKTAEDVKAGLASGGNDFILKPCVVGKLRERMAHWVSRQEPQARTR